MPITVNDFKGGTEDQRRALLTTARTYAPCLQTLSGVAREEALSILRVAAAELPAPGYGRVTKISRNGTSMDFDSGGAFSSDAITALRALCSTAASVPGLPRGSFPVASPVVKQWPEKDYT